MNWESEDMEWVLPIDALSYNLIPGAGKAIRKRPTTN